jgi:hypothetical protein
MTHPAAHRGGHLGTPQLCTPTEQRQAARDAATITRIRALAATSRLSDMYGEPCVSSVQLLLLLDGLA